MKVHLLFLSLPFSEAFSAAHSVHHKRWVNTILSSSTSDDEIIQNHRDHSIRDSFNLIVLGDLHLEDDMTKHNQARDDCISALKKLSLLPSPPPTDENDSGLKVHDLVNLYQQHPAGKLSCSQLEMLLEYQKQDDKDLLNCHLVSLGDLGRKDIRHEPGDAGTTKSFQDAKDFFDSFSSITYNLVTGNHDLEGLDEFDTDEGNLQAWMDCFGKDKPYFSKQIGPKTLLVGLSTVRFRNSPHSSHECHVDDEQLEWFQEVLKKTHPDQEEGWRVCVFTHAPIMGSNLRVLQNVHVINGCAWMNHCSESRSSFIEAVKNNPQIKLWSSGHFHLSHEFADSLSNVNQCTFMQVGVVGEKSTRDHTRQTRIVQGNSREFNIYTVNHHVRMEDGSADVRLDATIDLSTGELQMQDNKPLDGDESDDVWDKADNVLFGAYVPQEEDGCYLESPNGRIVCENELGEKGKVKSALEFHAMKYHGLSLS